MDRVCHQHHSWSPPASSPEKTTPAASKPKKRAGRKVLNETRQPAVRRKKGGKWVCGVRETTAAAALPGGVTPARPESPSSSREFCPASSLGGIIRDEEVGNPSLSKYGISRKINDSWWSEGFVDEEAVFNMPALLDGMAEGMLLSPFSWTQYEVDDEAMELSLWAN